MSDKLKQIGLEEEVQEGEIVELSPAEELEERYRRAETSAEAATALADYTLAMRMAFDLPGERCLKSLRNIFKNNDGTVEYETALNYTVDHVLRIEELSAFVPFGKGEMVSLMDIVEFREVFGKALGGAIVERIDWSEERIEFKLWDPVELDECSTRFSEQESACEEFCITHDIKCKVLNYEGNGYDYVCCDKDNLRKVFDAICADYPSLKISDEVLGSLDSDISLDETELYRISVCLDMINELVKSSFGTAREIIGDNEIGELIVDWDYYSSAMGVEKELVMSYSELVQRVDNLVLTVSEDPETAVFLELKELEWLQGVQVRNLILDFSVEFDESFSVLEDFVDMVQENVSGVETVVFGKAPLGIELTDIVTAAEGNYGLTVAVGTDWWVVGQHARDYEEIYGNYVMVPFDDEGKYSHYVLREDFEKAKLEDVEGVEELKMLFESTPSERSWERIEDFFEGVDDEDRDQLLRVMVQMINEKLGWDEFVHEMIMEGIDCELTVLSYLGLPGLIYEVARFGSGEGLFEDVPVNFFPEDLEGAEDVREEDVEDFMEILSRAGRIESVEVFLDAVSGPINDIYRPYGKLLRKVRVGEIVLDFSRANIQCLSWLYKNLNVENYHVKKMITTTCESEFVTGCVTANKSVNIYFHSEDGENITPLMREYAIEVIPSVWTFAEVPGEFTIFVPKKFFLAHVREYEEMGLEVVQRLIDGGAKISESGDWTKIEYGKKNKYENPLSSRNAEPEDEEWKNEEPGYDKWNDDGYNWDEDGSWEDSEFGDDGWSEDEEGDW